MNIWVIKSEFKSYTLKFGRYASTAIVVESLKQMRIYIVFRLSQAPN